MGVGNCHLSVDDCGCDDIVNYLTFVLVINLLQSLVDRDEKAVIVFMNP